MARCSGCSGDRCSCVLRAGANVSISGAGTATNPFVITAAGDEGQAVPTGTIVMYGGAAAPAGWLICNGAAINRTAYAALYAAIGTTYGVGDNSTTFGLPDLTSRFPIGATPAAPYPRGAQGGAAQRTIATANLPSHSHTIPNHVHDMTHDHSASAGNDSPDHSHAYYREGFTAIDYLAGGGTGALVASGAAYAPETFGASQRHSHAITVNTRSQNTGGWSGSTGNTGSGTPLDTLPPYTSVNFLIKT